MKLRIVLPIPLPTWNRILAMGPWERKRLRDYLHLFVLLSIRYGEDWPTATVFQRKRVLTASLKQDYLKMIRPSTSKKSGSVRKKRKTKRRSLPLRPRGKK